ncbi:MAG: HEPN domain-containing protein [Pseudomonadota bacterium]
MRSSAMHWAEQARYDLDTAKAMFDSGRYLYVLFCCQQAAEKMLKALIAMRTEELPPRIHQLVRLSEVAGLEVGQERADFLRELSAYYIQTRYPEEIGNLASQVKEQEARRVLDQTEEVLQWLSSML